MNKKILISLSVIGVVSVIAIGGTIAYYNDTETSSGNAFLAGTLNLKVDNDDPTARFYSAEDIKPGYEDKDIWELRNTGSLDGYLHITFANLVNDEMGCPEPEQNEGGDTTCDNPGEGQGELAENLDILIYLDENTNEDFDLGIDTLIYQGKVRGILQGDLFNYKLNSGDEKDFIMEMKVDSSVGNIIQSDKAGYDINFELTQNKKEDIVGDWHFDENGGSTAYDNSGYGNNGTIYGASWSDGKYNPALSFDGVDDYVQIPNDPSLQINKAITLSVWIKTPSSWNMQYPTPLSKAQLFGTPPNHDWDGEYWIAIRSSDKRFTFTFAPAGGSAIDHWSSSTLAFTTWYHIVATFDDNANKVRLYLNGVLDKEFTENATPGITNLPVKIGHGGYSNNYFKGIVDEVRIYNRVLSDAEISEIYQKGL